LGPGEAARAATAPKRGPEGGDEAVRGGGTREAGAGEQAVPGVPALPGLAREEEAREDPAAGVRREGARAREAARRGRAEGSGRQEHRHHAVAQEQGEAAERSRLPLAISHYPPVPGLSLLYERDLGLRAGKPTESDEGHPLPWLFCPLHNARGTPPHLTAQTLTRNSQLQPRDR
jgi:hypothetical protein